MSGSGWFIDPWGKHKWRSGRASGGLWRNEAGWHWHYLPERWPCVPGERGRRAVPTWQAARRKVEQAHALAERRAAKGGEG